MKPKKSYGQHFLTNESLARKIVEVFHENLDVKNVMEVGPGKGAITKYLLQLNYHYVAVEADRDMIEYLWTAFPQKRDFFVHANFLKVHFDQFFEGEQFAVIGNFPYNISSQIIIKVEQNKARIPMVYGMFQKEVADRIVAPHGSKTYGILSVIFQSFYECSLLQKIQPGSFTPPPKVISAMVMMKRREDFSIPCNETIMKKIVRVSFNQRRKMLRNSLKAIIEDEEILKNDIFTQRPEQLSKEMFYEITNLLESYIIQTQ